MSKRKARIYDAIKGSGEAPKALGVLEVLGISPSSTGKGPVLDNKLGLTDSMSLLQLEAAFSIATIPLALERLRQHKKFGLRQLQLAHGIIFQPVYPWAGKLRTVDIAKQDKFAPHESIRDQADRIFRKFHERYAEGDDLAAGLKQYPPREIATALADLYNELNLVHAFREGNGRSQRALCTAIARQTGYDLDWKAISFQKYEFDQACISKARGNSSPLAILFQSIIVPRPELGTPRLTDPNQKRRSPDQPTRRTLGRKIRQIRRAVVTNDRI